MNAATDSTRTSGVSRASAVDIELAAGDSRRMSRAMWLAVRGLQLDKECLPTDEDLNALEHLAFEAFRVAKSLDDMLEQADQAVAVPPTVLRVA